MFRQQLQQMRAIGAKLCSETIQAMLGYSMLFPFIGFVDGRDPRRLLE